MRLSELFNTNVEKLNFFRNEISLTSIYLLDAF